MSQPAISRVALDRVRPLAAAAVLLGVSLVAAGCAKKVIAAAPAAPLLRTRETANDAEATRKVKEVLTRTEQTLGKVNYRALSANGKAQADTVRRMIAQVGEALEKRNYVFALSLAEKAETLSTSLVNR